MKLIRQLFKGIFKGTIDFLFPKAESVRDMEKMESTALISLLRQSEVKLETSPVNVVSLFPYRDDRVHTIIHEIKYHANSSLAHKIAPALYDALNEIMGHDNPNQRPIVTFIPATQSRKEKRGFDQGSIILDAIRAHEAQVHSDYRQFIFEYNRDLLAWSRNVSQQSLTANREERLNNMNNALISTEASLIGKAIIVLDDVCTTGATLADAKRALEAAGASKVYLLTIAH